jgi:hypothetical protein
VLVEVRMVFGKNIVDLTDKELERAIATVRSRTPASLEQMALEQ